VPPGQTNPTHRPTSQLVGESHCRSTQFGRIVVNAQQPLHVLVPCRRAAGWAVSSRDRPRVAIRSNKVQAFAGDLVHIAYPSRGTPWALEGSPARGDGGAVGVGRCARPGTAGPWFSAASAALLH